MHISKDTPILGEEYCLKLINNGIKPIIANCPSLESLETKGCSMLTNRWFNTLKLCANCLKESLVENMVFCDTVQK